MKYLFLCKNIKNSMRKISNRILKFIVFKLITPKSCRFAKENKETNTAPWPILITRYQFLSLLGKGGFSEVYKVDKILKAVVNSI